MNFIVAKCEQCGASLEVDNDKEKAYCTQCGQLVLISSSKTINNTYIVNNQNTIQQTPEQPQNRQIAIQPSAPQSSTKNPEKKENNADRIACIIITIASLILTIIFAITSFTRAHELATERNNCQLGGGVSLLQVLDEMLSHNNTAFLFSAFLVFAILFIILLIVTIVKFAYWGKEDKNKIHNT